jgi:ketosteroid isomerase-like protein
MNNPARARSPRLLTFCLAACLLTVATVSGQAQSESSAQKPSPASAAVRAVLDAQVAAWNAGELEKFMAGYWRSPKLTFFSGGSRQQGWDATLARYRRNYQSEGREMGRLAFSELDIQPLGADSAVVRGRWQLTLSNGKQPGGLFTLVFRRFRDGWKIIHDHTSADQ